MKVEKFISASWFYTDSREKTKLNWFLYEYACKLFEHIGESRKKTVREWKARRGDERIAEFCAYFAKRMRRNAFSRSAEVREEDIITADEFIRDYWHTNTRLETGALADIGEAAWLELLESCRACTVGCLVGMHERCDFFDRMERGGYFTQ